jgi:hypothetical protein
VDCLGIIDEVRVILGRRLLGNAVQKRQNTDKMHTVPGAEPPKLMPPPSKFLNRSMLSRGLQRGGVEEGWMWFCVLQRERIGRAVSPSQPRGQIIAEK